MTLQTDNEGEQRRSSHFSLDSDSSLADRQTAKSIDARVWNARVNVTQSRLSKGLSVFSVYALTLTTETFANEKPTRLIAT